MWEKKRKFVVSHHLICTDKTRESPSSHANTYFYQNILFWQREWPSISASPSSLHGLDRERTNICCSSSSSQKAHSIFPKSTPNCSKTSQISSWNLLQKHPHNQLQIYLVWEEQQRSVRACRRQRRATTTNMGMRGSTISFPHRRFFPSLPLVITSQDQASYGSGDGAVHHVVHHLTIYFDNGRFEFNLSNQLHPAISCLD